MFASSLFANRLFGLISGFGAGVFALAAAPASGQSPQSPPPAPIDYTLKSITTEDTFRSAEARGWYVALHFLLKTECPVCLRHTNTYLGRQDEVPGVRQIFVKPDTDAEITAWAGKLEEKLPAIYRDPDAALAKRFNIPFGYQFHGQTVHYPALVLLGPDGREIFRYVGKNNTDRFSFDDLAKKIAELTADPAIAQWNLGPGGLALGGYDPVAYVGGGAGSMPGQESLKSQFRGMTFRFTHAVNRRAFAQSPQNYLPAAGGWCAASMAQGKKAAPDPAHFKIINNRLYLFSRDEAAMTAWNKDEAAGLRAAESNWAKLIANGK